MNMFKTKRKRKIGIILVLIFAVALVTARAYLPIWLKGYVNEQIAVLGDYGGGVEDIDVHLWRGAYQIHGMNIHKSTGGIEKPFVAADTVDLSLEWAALLKGAIVAEIDIYNADLNFSKTQTGEDAGWIGFVEALSPFDINRLDVHSGKLTYTDYSAEPNVHLYIDDIDAQVTNLRQVQDKSTPLPSNIDVSGVSIGGGALSVKGGMNILRDVPDFDLTFKLEDADLTAFNDYARNSAAIDFEGGDLSIFAEIAAADGVVTGYVKPIALNLSLVDLEQDPNPINAIWESLVSVFLELFENQSQDQFAMRIPIEGNLNNPEQNLWSGFISIFSNAFVQAFEKDSDGTVSYKDVSKE